MTTATITDWPAEIERLAREAEKEALAKADSLFAEYVAEHERQTAGFSFDCRRHGDYLTVFMERAANAPEWGEAKAETKASTSLNIGAAKQIRLIEGHCFDRRGSLDYRAGLYSDDGKSGGGWGTGAGRTPPWKGYHYRVSPNYAWLRKQRPMIVVEKDKESDNFRGGYGMDDYQPRHLTEDFPRPAKDDEIIFTGIRATIFAPAGKGRGVYDAIMAEIARGYEPPAIADAHPEGGDA